MKNKDFIQDPESKFFEVLKDVFIGVEVEGIWIHQPNEDKNLR